MLGFNRSSQHQCAPTSSARPKPRRVFSTTSWTSGNLGDYLGIHPKAGGPDNPIGGLLPATQVHDAAATGYYAYQSDFGTVNFGSGTDPEFSITSSLSHRHGNRWRDGKWNTRFTTTGHNGE
jgi:hypothetical protein